MTAMTRGLGPEILRAMFSKEGGAGSEMVVKMFFLWMTAVKVNPFFVVWLREK